MCLDFDIDELYENQKPAYVQKVTQRHARIVERTKDIENNTI